MLKKPSPGLAGKVKVKGFLLFLGNGQGLFEYFQPFVDFLPGNGQWRRDTDDTLRTAQKQQSTFKGQVHDTIAKLFIRFFAQLDPW